MADGIDTLIGYLIFFRDLTDAPALVIEHLDIIDLIIGKESALAIKVPLVWNFPSRTDAIDSTMNGTRSCVNDTRY